MLSFKLCRLNLVSSSFVFSVLGLLTLGSCGSSESDDLSAAVTDTSGAIDDEPASSSRDDSDSSRLGETSAGQPDVDGHPASEQSGGATAIAGGQSGGESEGSGAAERPATELVCACLDTFLQDDSTPVALRASVLRIEGTCVELRVEEELATIWGIEVGDVIGGSWQELCPGGETDGYAEGDQVLAVYQQHYESYQECPEYQACTEELCGDQPDGESDISDWDRCNGQCVEDTREVCDKLSPEQEQLSGTVRLAPLDGTNVDYFWAGEKRTETLNELAEPECRQRHAEQNEAFQAMTETQTSSGAMQADAPPPASGGISPTAPAPGASPMPGGEAPGACLLPGWENYFEELSSPEAGADAEETPTRVPSVEAGVSSSPSSDSMFDAGTNDDSNGG